MRFESCEGRGGPSKKFCPKKQWANGTRESPSWSILPALALSIHVDHQSSGSTGTACDGGRNIKESREEGLMRNGALGLIDSP